ncbi:hypothetical protein AMEX_G2119 [Astyanax mexicanus]|uniref:Uncharacterized protein n=1 Tax=Astyanax mexicanus TaxID=7994 RepID=A0A8T2MIC8_ASTMX|nr:hypothetical protein AMEX_G2119 [Astyanax mexicanus]
MSTHDLTVKLNSSSSSAGSSPPEQQRTEAAEPQKLSAGNKNEPALTGTSANSLQTNKNLYIRRKILLNSKGDWTSPTGDLKEVPDQLRFTSFFSLRLPSKRSEKNKKYTETKLISNDIHRKPDAVRRPANVQYPELKTNRDSAGKEKDENFSKPPFQKGCTTIPQQKHFGHDIPCHRSEEGTQHGVALCDPAQTAQNCSQEPLPSSDHLTQQPIGESKTAARESGVNDPFRENAEGALCNSNLILFGEASSSKASTNCQPAACSPRALKRALSLPSFPAPHHSCKSETDPSHTGPAAKMFTSTLVSVLAPHWSGRFRRPKRDVSEVEQDGQVSGQNSNQSVSTQNSPHQPFLLTQMRAGGETVDKFNDKLRDSAGTSRSTAEWQKDTTSSQHFTATLHTIRPRLKPTPLDTSQKTADAEDVEHRTSVHLPLDSNQVTRSALSLQVRGYKRISQPEDQAETFSPPTSRPTTSSLLLSWRRLKSRTENDESTEMEKQLTTSVRSLTLPNKSKLRLSQPHTPLFSPDSPTKENVQRYTFPASSEQIQSPETSPVSPHVREMRTSRRSMFLINREFNISSKSTSTINDTNKDRIYSSSTTGSNQSESLNASQEHSRESLERKCSHLGNNESVQHSITDYKNSNINSLHRTATDLPKNTPKDNTNNNIGTSISNRYHISDNIVQNHISQPTESTSQSTSPQIIQITTVNLTAGIPPGNLTQTGQNSNQNSTNNIRSLYPENLSPSPIDQLSGRTFTGSLVFTPRKEISAMERTSPSHVWQNYLNLRQSQSNQSSSDQTNLLSSARPLRQVRAPSIYSYLRETSPPLTTQTSTALNTSPSPLSPFLKQEDQIKKENQNAGISRFTFDLSQVETKDVSFRSPQSLPPDSGRRSELHLSKSPYSTLISARPRLNSALHNPTSPPVTHQHRKSASYDSSATTSSSPKAEDSSYLLVQKYNRIKGVSDSASDKRFTMEPTLKPCSTSQSSPVARFTDSQTTNSIPDTTFPSQSGIIDKDICQTGPDGTFLSQSVKGSTSAAQELCSSTLSMLTVSETVPAITKDEVTPLQTHETLQGIQRSNSKRSFFSRSKEENSQTSSAFADKQGLTNQDGKSGEMTGLKNSNKMDQVLNRLRMKFGVKRSEDDDLTARRKTKNQQSSDLKAPECKKNEVCHESQTLKSPVSSQITNRKDSSGALSGFTFSNEKCENSPNVDKHKRLADENGNQFLGRPQSPNWPKPHYINRYATMPQTRKTTAPGPSSTFYPSAFSSKDSQSDDVFDSCFSTRTKNSLVGKTENVSGNSGNAQNSQRQRLMGAHLSASCANLKYGLERGRSVSVSSIVSGRPSGPGRISTGSRQGSVSDFSSLDEFAPRSRHSSISNPGNSPEHGVTGPSSLPVHSTYRGCVGRLQSNDRLWSPGNLDSSSCAWDAEANPTPPPSPPFSPTSRRISQVPSSSSTSSRTSLDSLSPRGFLPSRSYKTTLSVFEESSSDSDTTTDDEYYLNNDGDDEKETEL